MSIMDESSRRGCLGLNVMDFLRESIQHFILGGREPPSFLKAIAQQHYFATEE